jgi:hypothetical protein
MTKQYEVHTCLTFRTADLIVICVVESGELVEMWAESTRRGSMVRVSDSVRLAFWKQHQDFLERECNRMAQDAAEMYGDMAFEERRERRIA